LCSFAGKMAKIGRVQANRSARRVQLFTPLARAFPLSLFLAAVSAVAKQ
jgi:hypothetical protein